MYNDNNDNNNNVKNFLERHFCRISINSFQKSIHFNENKLYYRQPL